MLTLVLACCSFAYHLILITNLATLLGSSAYWHSISVATYLCGAGLGVYFTTRQQYRNVLTALFKVEVWLTAIGSSTAVYLCLSHIAYRYVFQSAVMDYFGEAPVSDIAAYLEIRRVSYTAFIVSVQIASVILGYFTGWELPLLLSLARSKRQGFVLGLHYAGGVVASLLLCFWLIPSMRLPDIALGFGALNLVICLCIIVVRQSPTVHDGMRLGAVTVALAVIFATNQYIEQIQSKTFYHYRHGSMEKANTIEDLLSDLSHKPSVTRFHSPYQVADIVQITWPNLPPLTTLFLNGHFQFDTRQERFYHETMAHVPLAVTGVEPKQILVLGGGDGLLARELLKYKIMVQSIQLVEIDPMIPKIMKSPMLNNLDDLALNNPKVEITYDDALHFVRQQQATYDGIYIDMPHPANYDLAKLYSVEFYQSVAARLKAGGFVMLDAPVYPTTKDKGALADVQYRSNSIILSTLKQAGLKWLAPMSLYGNSFVLASKTTRTWKPPNKLIDPLYALRLDDFAIIANQSFPHEISSDHVNSIFRPRLIDLPDPTM